MAEQLVCGWDEFDVHATNTIKKLWHDKEYTDVTLATVDDQQISAHRVVLSSSSYFFKQILSKNNQKNLVLYLKDIKYNELQLVLEFIYFGECKVPHENLGNFIATGNTLEVIGLIKGEEEKTVDKEKSDCLVKELIKENQKFEVHPDNWEIETITDETQSENNDVVLQSVQSEHEQICENELDRSLNAQQFGKEIIPTQQGDKADKLTQLRQDRLNHISAQFFKDDFFRCEECPVLYKDIFDLKKHINTVHGGITYRCSQCEYKTKRFKAGLTPHMIKHGVGFWYYCDKCDYKATQLKNLKVHRQFLHENANFCCKQCDYRSTREFNLHHHIKIKHEGVRYECDICDHKTTTPNSLLNHKYKYHKDGAIAENKDSK